MKYIVQGRLCEVSLLKVMHSSPPTYASVFWNLFGASVKFHHALCSYLFWFSHYEDKETLF